jgi:predicted nuclease of predicted toxin-antitoxin system
MKFLADECVYRITVQMLRAYGHDVLTVQEAGFAGKSDDEVLAHAVAEGRILLTNDMHFSNTLLFPTERHLGVVVLKIRPRTLEQVHDVLIRFLDIVDQEAMEKTLVIIDRNKYRVRR